MIKFKTNWAYLIDRVYIEEWNDLISRGTHSIILDHIDLLSASKSIFTSPPNPNKLVRPNVPVQGVERSLSICESQQTSSKYLPKFRIGKNHCNQKYNHLISSNTLETYPNLCSTKTMPRPYSMVTQKTHFCGIILWPRGLENIPYQLRLVFIH